MEDQRDLVN